MNQPIQNLLDTAKVVLRRKSQNITGLPQKQENSQINNLTVYLEELEKRKTNSSKLEQRK